MKTETDVQIDTPLLILGSSKVHKTIDITCFTGGTSIFCLFNEDASSHDKISSFDCHSCKFLRSLELSLSLEADGLDVANALVFPQFSGTTPLSFGLSTPR